MESTSERTLALKKNGITLTEYQDAFGSDAFHFKAIHQPTSATGFGSDRSRDLAIVKAVGELLERHTFHVHSARLGLKNSSGFACHRTPAQARESARLELLERDAFLLSWLSRKAPAWIAEQSLEAPLQSDLAELSDRFKAQGLEVRYGIVSITGGAVTVIAGILPYNEQLKFGFGISTCARMNLVEALRGVSLDMRRLGSLLLSRARSGQPLYSSVDSNRIEHPYQHMEYYFDPAPASTVGWFWELGKDVLLLEECSMEVEEVKAELSLGLEFHVSRAHSNQLQEYFVGLTTESGINGPRLSKVSCGPANMELHPLG